jgi:predicted peroxiredoxin
MLNDILIRALLLPLLALLLSGCTATETPAVSAEVAPARDGVFLHISHGAEHPQRVLMGLRMANVMAADKDVLVYFDVKGVEVVLKESGGISLDSFDSAATQLQGLLEKGVNVHVCPSCLAAAGKSQDDVIQGVKIADKEAFFNFTEGRILTLDY